MYILYDFLCLINFCMFHTLICYFLCILIIYIADHWFIPAVPLCSADRFFFLFFLFVFFLFVCFFLSGEIMTLG